MKQRKKDKQLKQREAEGRPRCGGCGNAFPRDQLVEADNPNDRDKKVLLCAACEYESAMDE